MSKLIWQRSSGSFEASREAVRDGQLNLYRRDQKQSLLALRKRDYSPNAGILSVLRIFSKAPLGILLIGLAATWITPSLLDSMSQRTLHRAAVHSDRTSV